MTKTTKRRARIVPPSPPVPRENADPLWVALVAQCAKIRGKALRAQVQTIIEVAAKHADDNVVFTEDRDEDDPQDDGGWLVDFRQCLTFESGNATVAVERWFKRHNSLANISPICRHLRARCAQIENVRLRSQIRTIINAAAENADEYDEPAGGGWDDAFTGTIETKCEGDVPETVRQWFDRQMVGPLTIKDANGRQEFTREQVALLRTIGDAGDDGFIPSNPDTAAQCDVLRKATLIDRVDGEDAFYLTDFGAGVVHEMEG